VVFNLDGCIHVFRGFYYFYYNTQISECTKPVKTLQAWPMLEDIDFEQVDAAFVGKYLTSSIGEDLSRKLYLFKRDKYIRLDVDTNTIDPGYPRLISEGWPGVHFERIDAVLNTGADTLYFFLGGKYIRFNMINNHADPGYPDLISKRWLGVTFERIDAAVYWGNGKVFFFRGNDHIRYDMTTYRVDPGYPKSIFGNYVEDWKFFD
jgi:hypothetical protein